MRYFILILFLVLVPHTADAATIRVVAPETVNVGEHFSVEVFLDTEGENINALEGSIILPEGVTLSEIRYRGSVVSLWLSPPAERAKGTIDFEGVLPGGYQASPERLGSGNLFTVALTADREGTARFSFGETLHVYRNDGEGTVLPISKSPVEIRVVASGAPNFKEFGVDTYPPEVFTPAVVSGDLYNIAGDVLVFVTQDKDTGVRGYEVGFSYVGFLPEFFVAWRPAESPLQISGEVSGKYAFVRATDGAGNTRVATLPPVRPGFASFFMTWGLPAAVLLFVGFLFLSVFFAKRKVSLR